MTLDETECRILAEARRRNSDNVSRSRGSGKTREKLRYRVQKSLLKTSD